MGVCNLAVLHFSRTGTISVEIILAKALPDGNPEQQTRYFLRNQAERRRVKIIGETLDAVLDKVDIEQPDSAYLNTSLWVKVLKAAQHAYEVRER